MKKTRILTSLKGACSRLEAIGSEVVPNAGVYCGCASDE